MTAQIPLWERPLAGVVQDAHDIVEQATTEHRPEATFLLISGGNDSAVLLDTMAEHADAIIHINTGIGIPEANAHARRVGESYGKPFVELHPPDTYEELVLGRWDGLPGPGAHIFTYQRLKDRCIEALLRDARSRDGERFLLLSGVRKAESKRRMGYSNPIQRRGGQVWVNPLFRWQNDEMRRYRCDHDLTQSDVAANLHMSGECLCGAMADQDINRSERAQVRFFYPGFESRLTALEEDCRQQGKRYCEWGVKRPGRSTAELLASMGEEQLPFDDFAPLCVGCEFRGTP